MMDDAFAARAGEWLAPGGPANDIVVSTRIRLARNLRGHKMPWRLAESERDALAHHLRERLSSTHAVPEATYWNIAQLSEVERLLLVERHLISRELAAGKGHRGVLFSPRESLSVMTLEEDHLRLQSIRCGLQLDVAWRELAQVDNEVERAVPYAVSSRFGYLTACPTNVGTGLRVSVMTHLPTLVQTRQIKKVKQATSKVGLVLRGLYGEGTKAYGDFYQISNQVTFGRSEEEILQQVQDMVGKIIDWERGVRSLLLERDRIGLEDRIWRAWGTLKMARRISSEDAMEQLSSVRLGVNTKVLGEVSLQTLNELFLFIQPAHLQILRQAPDEAAHRDAVRARFIREHLAG
ncbi:MAG: protein arginine kinase [Planctomycetes bacterium]|nr:protein arginine kinase [Planctomycetota bacterium]